MYIFKCPICKNALSGFKPSKCLCGYSIPIVNGVYQFTTDEAISLEANGLKWLGYEIVGENYEPGYYYNKDKDNIMPSYYLAEFLGENKVILDIGAGLGGSSISFALSGIYTIAADISQLMLEKAIERARRSNTPQDKIIFVRMNGYKLEIENSSIDAVIAVDMLHQVDRPELVVEEIKRVLRHDGYFIQYGAVKSLGYTQEQVAANNRYNEALRDIESYYNKIICDAGYGEPPFSSWEKAEECIRDNFVEYKRFENSGIYSGSNMKWTLKFGLHKIKTKASGYKQLIPDEIHNEAWSKTDSYAKSKYGENYEEISRYYNFTSNMILYRKNKLL